MFSKLFEFAKKEGLRRISMHVVAGNERAIGVIKDSYCGEDRKYHDELMIGLMLE